ncbi:hypothetical protein [Leucothrix pacifica]|uniref:Uncharacterized protein n=1 Tax=Leucothrix pacifica TaxID=1247513 RepID=A0A317CEU1_9GAMM|nr:hypothetical protein [Leucothrix pacifica]PWQ96601.1 hypothetical protein DKW60_12520 [Leucothrix pacifica]
MLRLTLILMVIIGLLILLGAGYLAYRKVRKSIGDAWDKGTEIANEQQQRWKQREQLKSQPDYIQKAFKRSEQVESDTQLLPEDWQSSLAPLNTAMQKIFTITIGDEKRADKVRSFYNTSLPAYASFVAKLRSDHAHLDEQEKTKAVENIDVFEADFERYLGQIQQARRFDFDVLMDVIKVRLKNR